jgi:hypothetical protein
MAVVFTAFAVGVPLAIWLTPHRGGLDPLVVFLVFAPVVAFQWDQAIKRFKGSGPRA